LNFEFGIDLRVSSRRRVFECRVCNVGPTQSPIHERRGRRPRRASSACPGRQQGPTRRRRTEAGEEIDAGDRKEDGGAFKCATAMHLRSSIFYFAAAGASPGRAEKPVFDERFVLL